MANGLVKGSGVGDREWRGDFELVNDSGTTVFKVAKSDGAVTMVGGVVRTGQKTSHTLGAKAGATAGWVVNAANNLGLAATCPASQTASTLVIPITGLKAGSTITAFNILAQIESAGGAVTLDADLRKLTLVAGDVTDASIGAITQVAVTADTASVAAKTLTAPEVIADGETFYVLLTATTAASTDIALQGVSVTVTEA